MSEPWRCEAHNLTTRTDCPKCDDEMIADLEARYGTPTPPLFVAPDGENEPTLWRTTDRPDYPAVVLRLCDLPSEHRDLWPHLTAAAIESFGPQGGAS